MIKMKLTEIIESLYQDIFILDTNIDFNFRKSFNELFQTGKSNRNLDKRLKVWENLFEYKNVFITQGVKSEISRLLRKTESLLDEPPQKRGKHRYKKRISGAQKQAVILARNGLNHILKKAKTRELDKHYPNLDFNKYKKILTYLDGVLKLKGHRDFKEGNHTDEEIVSASICLSESGKCAAIVTADGDIVRLYKTGLGILCAPEFSPYNNQLRQTLMENPITVYHFWDRRYNEVRTIAFNNTLEKVLEQHYKNQIKKNRTAKKLSDRELEKMAEQVHLFYQYL